MPASIFQITDGRLAFKLVDTGDVGYADAWQSPDGKTLLDVVFADYDVDRNFVELPSNFGFFNGFASGQYVSVPATFCQASSVVPQPGITSYSLDGEFLQDVNVMTGLSRYLFENDTEEAYFFLGLDGANPPKAIGRLRLVAGNFGGAARENLTATLSLPLSRKPDIAFGHSGTGNWVGVEGDGSILTPALMLCGSQSARRGLVSTR